MPFLNSTVHVRSRIMSIRKRHDLLSVSPKSSLKLNFVPCFSLMNNSKKKNSMFLHWIQQLDSEIPSSPKILYKLLLVFYITQLSGCRRERKRAEINLWAEAGVQDCFFPCQWPRSCSSDIRNPIVLPAPPSTTESPHSEQPSNISTFSKDLVRRASIHCLSAG